MTLLQLYEYLGEALSKNDLDSYEANGFVIIDGDSEYTLLLEEEQL